MSQAEAPNAIISFPQFRHLFFAAYSAGEMDRALALLREHEGGFPEHAATLSNWKICLLALKGSTEAALNAFRSALENGYWWTAEQLRGDSDLASLQGLPAFEEGVEICARRHQLAREQATPKRIDLLPALPAHQTRPLILVMHGHSGTASDNQDKWQAAGDCGWQVALLGSSQAVGYNSFCWDDRALALREVQQHIEDLRAAYPIELNRLVIAGFSQSGWLTAMWMLKGTLPATRFLLTCPATPLPQEINFLSHKPVPAGLRGVILAGEQDIPWVTTARRLDNYLTRRDIPHQTHIYANTGHEYPDSFVDNLPAWLDFLSN